MRFEAELARLIQDGIEEISHRAAARAVKRSEELNELLLREIRSLKEEKVQPELPEWLTTKQALELLDVARPTLWRYRKKGLVETQGEGRAVRYSLESIKALKN